MSAHEAVRFAIVSAGERVPASPARPGSAAAALRPPRGATLTARELRSPR